MILYYYQKVKTYPAPKTPPTPTDFISGLVTTNLNYV